MSHPPDSTHENRLGRETSPYLLQHRHNPVDWWPWGTAALAEAKSQGKPILLSVGYAACHWCHVMAHESFEDPATAAVMNELFVNIKVDREERPDVDQIYMAALHHLGEQGGWPLTMFLTSDGEPFWGGTYFPNTSRYGRPAFTDVLREVVRLFRDEPEKIEQNRRALMARLADKARSENKLVIGVTELDNFALKMAGLIDPMHGGLRGAPKFPQSTILEFLWRAGARKDDQRFYNLVELTLERISEGGIYDHLGGGYSRYSVDERWLVPHFEKMLYDNAQLLELLTVAWQRTRNPLFADRVRETISWLAREMTTGEGAFSASLDADSEGEEGKFYVWSAQEIISIFGAEDAEFFAHHYDVTTGGNFEGHNILNRLARKPRTEDDETRLASLRASLLAVRDGRVRPGLDDKVLADWNGLMIAALVHAGVAFRESSWIGMARRAFDFIATTMTKGDRLGHSWREGKLLYPGLASDFAAMIKAALALHEATGERGLLDTALAWQRAFDTHYRNTETGSYYFTADDAEGLVVRPSSTHDDATPNPNAIAAQNLVRLAALAGDDAFRARADRLIEGVLAGGADNLFAHTGLMNGIDLRTGAVEIVVTGPDSEGFVQAALQISHLSRILIRAPSADALAASHPAQEKVKATSGTAAFVCVGETCSLPLTKPEDIATRVAEMRRR